MYIETERLVICDYRMEDTADLQEILGDEETMRFCEPAYDFAKTEAFLRDFCIGRRGAVNAVLRETGKGIGYILCNETDAGEYEIGWFFHRKYWNRGYAQEACRALIQHILEESGAEKVFAETIDGGKSVHLMEKLGMRLEEIQPGMTREGVPTPLYVYAIRRKNR